MLKVHASKPEIKNKKRFIAHRTTNVDDVVVDDAVINLNAIAALVEHTRLIERIQMLRHIGLGGVDFMEQFTDIFLTTA